MADKDKKNNEQEQESIEIELISPLSKENVGEVLELMKHSIEEYKKDKTPDKLDYMIKFYTSASKVLEGTLEYHSKNSFINVAKKDGKSVGFSIVTIDNNGQVVDSFVGVGWDNLRKGIATQLIQARHSELRRRKMTSYHTDVWEGSRKLFEKEQLAGRISIQAEEDNPDSLTVTLKS